MEGGLFTERSASKDDEKKSPWKMDFEIDICKQTDPSCLDNPTGIEKEQPFRLSVKGYTRQSSYLASQAGGYEASNLSQNQSPSVYNHMQEGDEMDFLDEGAGESYTKLSRSPELKSMGLFTESPPEKHSLFDMKPVLRESHFDGMSPPHKTFNNPREPQFMIETKDQDHGPSKYKQEKRGITSPTSSFSSRGEGSIRARNAGLHKIKEETSYQDDVSASEQYEHSHMGIASARSCLHQSAKDSTFKRGEMNKIGIENSVGSDEKSDQDPKGEMFASVNPGRAVLLSARSAVIPNQSEIEAAQWSHQKTARGEAKKPPLTSNEIPVPLSYEDSKESPKPTVSEVVLIDKAVFSGQECSMKKKPYQSTIANAGPGSTTDLISQESHIPIRGENINEPESLLIDKVVITSMRPALLQDPKTRSGNRQQVAQNATAQHVIDAQPNPFSSLDLIKKRFLKQTNRIQAATSEIIKKGLLKVPQPLDEIIFQEGNNGEFRISRDLDTSSQPPTKNSFQYSFSSSACKQQPSPVKLGGQSSGVQIHINNNHASNIIINTTTIQDGKNQERTPNNPTSIGIDIIFVDQEQRTQDDAAHPGGNPVVQERSLKRPAGDQKNDAVADKKYLLQSVSKPHKKQPVKASNSGVTPGRQPSKQQIGTVSGANSLRRDSSNPAYKSFLAGNKASKSTEQLGRVNLTKPHAELSEDLLPRGLKQISASNKLQVFSQRSPKPAKSSKLGLMSTPEKTRYLPGLEEPHFGSASKQSLSTGEFIRQKTLELSINTKTGTSTEPWTLSKTKVELAQRRPQEKPINQTSKWIAPVSRYHNSH